jgi:hypothetical protein
MVEFERTYKARVVLSARNSLEASQLIEKIVSMAEKEGFHILVDDITELI